MRKRLVNLWDRDLQILHQKGWTIKFDPNSYPAEIQPIGLGGTSNYRPRGFYDLLINGLLNITLKEILPSEIALKSQALEKQSIENPPMNGDRVKELRLQLGWSQRKLAINTNISQGLISLIENGDRRINPENAEILARVLNYLG